MIHILALDSVRSHGEKIEMSVPALYLVLFYCYFGTLSNEFVIVIIYSVQTNPLFNQIVI